MHPGGKEPLCLSSSIGSRHSQLSALRKKKPKARGGRKGGGKREGRSDPGMPNEAYWGSWGRREEG